MALGARLRHLFVCAASVGALSCASSPFARPSANGKPTIVNEGTGKTYSDCKTAFAEATGETVLRFSAGVFTCGPEIATQSDWLIVVGAGMGHTFLDAGTSADRLHLSAIRPGRLIRVEDLAFGGLTEQPSEDSRATLVRTAVASDRPVLFGQGDRGVGGSIVVVHSVLTSSTAPLAAEETMPKPLAVNGIERVAIVESVLQNVEQAFERFPAPGSIELLDDQVQAAFEMHDPAGKQRRDASFQPNVTCGNAKNPVVVCPGKHQEPDGDGAVAEAARRLLDGKPLADLEAPLREAGRGFAERFLQALGPAVRQPDVFWFDDPQAKLIDEESQLAGKAADAAIARYRAEEVVARCADPNVVMKTALERAKNLDRFLPEPQVETACGEKLRPRAKVLLDECQTGLEWDRLLDAVKDMDDALGDKGASVRACRDMLKNRANDLAAKGPLARIYLREVSRTLDLGASAGSASERASLDSVVASLPWVVTKTGRTVPQPSTPSVLDRLVKATLGPNTGDGRKLVDATGTCSLVSVAPGSPQMKAVGKVVLAEVLPNAAPSDEPRPVLELPVEATKDQLPAGTTAAGLNMALIKKCDENAAAAYPAAVAKYVTEELGREAAAGSVKTRVDAEVALFIVQGAADGKELARPPKNVPLVRVALAAVQDDLARGQSALTVQAKGAAPLPQAASDDVLAKAAKAVPDWGFEDLARAADVLSRAGLVDLDSCAFLLADVPWQPAEGALTGQVVLQSVPTTLRCRPDARGFELSVWVDGATPTRVRMLAQLEKALTQKLGAPTAMKTAYGPAVGWNARPRDRTAFVYRTVPPANSMLGYILVPIGSNWTYR